MNTCGESIHLRPSSTTDATTYTFHAFNAKGDRTFGWACCTVNDRTGELSIQSDWGDWSYRWDIGGLGKGKTLTEFICDRTDIDYLANKLNRGRSVFDAEGTIRRLRAEIVTHRRDDGQIQLATQLGTVRPCEQAWANAGDYINVRGIHHHIRGRLCLSRERAREMYDALGELPDTDHDATAFNAALSEAMDEDWSDNPLVHLRQIIREPWDYFDYGPPANHTFLCELILPALVDACAREVRRRSAAALHPYSGMEAA